MKILSKRPVQPYVIMYIDKLAFLQQTLVESLTQPRALGLASRAPWVWSWPAFLKVSLQGREAGPHWSSLCWLPPLGSSEVSNKLIAKLWKTLLGILLWACLSLLRWIFVMIEWFDRLKKHYQRYQQKQGLIWLHENITYKFWWQGSLYYLLDNLMHP